MHAITFAEHGGPEVLQWAKVPDPTPGPGDVIIAMVCIPGYALPINFPGIPQLGAIQRTVALKPRHSTTLLLE